MFQDHVLLKIFDTKDYYFTIHAANKYSLEMNVFFYIKAMKADNFSTWFLNDL